ncbi:MAG TPA: D-alanine--D-alanine ligase family protein [Acidimicrobiales bacterium]|nr:D-alanine--D-alanine ligase family protein [Acidimicrobiales bacterium]
MVEHEAASPSPGRVRLVVLYGGRSAEHEVSCISGFHVAAAVDRRRYDLRLVGITTDGRWVDTTAQALESGVRSLPTPDRVLAEHPDQEAGISDLGGADPAAAAGNPRPGPLVVLPLVHGPMGEDGTVQGLLELAGLPYCGPGVAGSAVAMDKGLAKSLLTAAGLPQARYLYFAETELLGPDGGLDPVPTGRIEQALGWPVFVKPANMGSSIGISKVKDPGGLDAAVTLALRYDTALVVEEAVTAREIEMGVLGWPDVRTSVPGEIKPSHDFYDFEDKYLDGSAALEIPARVPDEVAERMSDLARAACRALRIDSMARVDFFYEEDGRGLLINEVNTIPGFTPISMYPQMWGASGIAYSDLVDVLVEQALLRAERRGRFETGR